MSKSSWHYLSLMFPNFRRNLFNYWSTRWSSSSLSCMFWRTHPAVVTWWEITRSYSGDNARVRSRANLPRAGKLDRVNKSLASSLSTSLVLSSVRRFKRQHDPKHMLFMYRTLLRYVQDGAEALGSLIVGHFRKWANFCEAKLRKLSNDGAKPCL